MKFLGDDRAERLVAARRREPRRPRPRSSPTRRRRRNEVLGKLRAELGERLGLADPNVLAYGWVHRFPMYQWDAENEPLGRDPQPVLRRRARGRAAARRPRPATRPALAGRSGRPGPGDAVRHRAQRLGARRRLGPDLAPRPARAAASRSRATRLEADAREVRRDPRRVRVRRAAARRDRLGIDRWAALLADQTNIREVMAFPKTQSGSDLMLEAPVAAGAGAARRARPALRRRRQATLTAAPRRRRRAPPSDRRGRSRARGPRRRSPAGRGWRRSSGRCASRSRASSTAAPRSTPSTATVFRCLFGLPILALVGLARAPALRRAAAPRASGSRSIAGVFFAGDLTVLAPRDRVRRRGPGDGPRQPPGARRRRRRVAGLRGAAVAARSCALPIVLVGVVLISGVDRRAAPTARTRRSGVVLGALHRVVLRRLPARHPARRPRPAPAGRSGGDRDASRPRSSRRSSDVASATSNPTPAAPSLVWLALLGLTSQSLGYLLISISLPRLPAVVTSIILLVQPVVDGRPRTVLLDEPPSPVQLLGVALVIGGIAVATIPIGRLRDRAVRFAS